MIKFTLFQINFNFKVIESLVPLLIVIGSGLVSSYRSTQDSAETEFTQMLRLKQDALDLHLKSLMKNDEELAVHPATAEFFSGNSSQEEFLAPMVLNFQEMNWGAIHHVFLADPSGKVVLSPPHGQSTASHLGSHVESSYWQDALKGTPITDFFGFKEKTHFHQLVLSPVKISRDIRGMVVIEVTIAHEMELLAQKGFISQRSSPN